MEKVAKIFNDQQAELDERLAKQTITSTEYTNKTNELRRNMEELERQYEELNNKMEKQQFLLQKQKEYSDILKNKSKEL
ncbi:MAG: hypothetical protein LBG52_05750 [Candidatus Peribacteria bacterium]|jgi:hypothetical protein|nr:hypothetical protein [Candidatus Peribacteria bacterium]